MTQKLTNFFSPGYKLNTLMAIFKNNIMHNKREWKEFCPKTQSWFKHESYEYVIKNQDIEITAAQQYDQKLDNTANTKHSVPCPFRFSLTVSNKGEEIETWFAKMVYFQMMFKYCRQINRSMEHV